MKLNRLTAAVSALCLAAGVASNATAADATSGSFFNPAQDGHGFVFEELENGLLITYWYTYRPDGTSTFLLGAATRDGDSYKGTMSQTEGMTFGDFDPADNELLTWGDFEVTFDHCNGAEVSWNPTIEGYSAGSTTVQRLTEINGANCADSPVNWNFAVTLTAASGIEKGMGIFLADGTFALTHTDAASPKGGFGTWEMIDDSSFSFEGITYINNDPNPIDISGTATLTADGFESVTDQQVKLEAVRMDSTETNLDQASLEGDYNITDAASGFQLGSASLAADGTFTGSIFTCVLEGELADLGPVEMGKHAEEVHYWLPPWPAWPSSSRWCSRRKSAATFCGVCCSISTRALSACMVASSSRSMIGSNSVANSGWRCMTSLRTTGAAL